MFVHVEFGPDRQRPYSPNKYGVLYYEVINSPFMIFKTYLDIFGNIILNQCGKYLLTALFANENFGECKRSTTCSVNNCFPMKKKTIRQGTLIYATKLIKLLAVQATQVVNSRFIREYFNTYTLWDHYRNPYLSIDRPEIKKTKKMNSFCRSLTDAIQLEFNINANVFASRKKKIVHLSLHKPLIYYPFFKQIIRFIRKYSESRKYFCLPYILR